MPPDRKPRPPLAQQAATARAAAVRPRRAPAVERRSKKSHDAVLAAAEALLAARGYSSVSVDQIAEQAGVGKATIYRWWPNKAALFMELFTLLAARSQPPVDCGDLESDLRRLVRGAFQLFRETIAGVALAGFIAEAQANPAIADLLRNQFAPQRREMSARLFERAVARGELPAGYATDIHSDLVTGIVYHAILVGNAAMTDERADAIVAAILRGMPLSARRRPARPTADPSGRAKAPSRSQAARAKAPSRPKPVTRKRSTR